jgi:hypothetical protein
MKKMNVQIIRFMFYYLISLCLFLSGCWGGIRFQPSAFPEVVEESKMMSEVKAIAILNRVFKSETSEVDSQGINFYKISWIYTDVTDNTETHRNSSLDGGTTTLSFYSGRTVKKPGRRTLTGTIPYSSVKKITIHTQKERGNVRKDLVEDGQAHLVIHTNSSRYPFYGLNLKSDEELNDILAAFYRLCPRLK